MKVVVFAFLRYLPRRRALTFLQILGTMCGVAAVTGMFLSAGAALESFTRAVDFLRGETTHTLVRGTGPMSESVLAELALDEGLRSFSPLVEGHLRLGSNEVVRLLGVDVFLDRDLRGALYAGIGGIDAGELLRTFVLGDGAVLAASDLAGRIPTDADGRFSAAGGTLRLVGTFAAPPGEPLLLMDIAGAQELLGKRGLLDRVDLILDDARGFLGRWSEGFVVQSSTERRRSYEGMLRAFRLNLEALSFMALFVGVFLVYNTSMYAAVSRRRDAGVLRSLGASRTEVAAAFLLEVSLLGAVGGLAGGVLGHVLSAGLTTLVGRTVSDLYFPLSPVAPAWSWKVAAAGTVLGWMASVVGAARPVAEFLRVEPVRALGGVTVYPAVEPGARRAALAGLFLMLSSLALSVPEGLGVYGGFAAAFGFLAGASLVSGSAIVGSAPLMRRSFGAVAGLPGKLAAGALVRNLARTSVAVAAFMVALSLSVGLGTMIDSFRSSLQRWMEGQLTGEVYIGSSPEVTIPEGLFEEISSLPGVAGVDRYRNEEGIYAGETIRVAAVDAAVLQRHARFWWVEGGDENWDPVRRGGVIVSESFARRFGRRRGDTVQIEGRKGRESFEIAAVFRDYTTEHGLVMMDRATYLDAFEDTSVDSLGVFFEKGVAAREDLAARVAGLARRRGLPIWSRQAFFGRILAIFDSTFAVTRSMRAMAIVVAFLGIAGALLTIFLERGREFGIYRALGFSAGEVTAMTLLEGLGLGAVSFLLCAPAGTVLAHLLIRVINLRSFNWTIFYHFSWSPYLFAAATSLAAGVAAAVYPAWKLRRTWPDMQMRVE